MADAIQITVSDNDFIEVTGAGSSGSVLHQGGATGNNSSSIILVESSTKPVIDPANVNRFKDTPASLYLQSGKSESYFSAGKIWAISQSGDQLLSVTPAV